MKYTKRCFSEQSATVTWKALVMNIMHTLFVCGWQVYICDGYTETERLLSAESFNPESNQWTLIAAAAV